MQISRGELIHYKIQAAMKKHSFPPNELFYLGEREGEHWYLIEGKHEVQSSLLEDFEVVD